MVWDGADGYMLLFGGAGQRSTLNDTWTFSNDTWRQIATANAPSTRLGLELVYDAADGYVLAYGSSGTATYTWKYVAGAWSNISSSISPGLTGGSLTYDAADSSVVLFGGYAAGRSPALCRGIDGNCNETWIFSNGTWTNATVQSAIAPQGRAEPAAAYDAARKALVVFGGLSVRWSAFRHLYVSVRLNDTWVYRGGNWTRLVGHSSPPTSFQASLSYVSSSAYDILYAGYRGTKLATATWELGTHGWSQLQPPVPSPRYAFGMVSDTFDHAIVLFGGETQGGAANDTWLHANESWTEVTGGIAPSPRFGFGMDYDNSTGAVLVFGGEASNGTLLNDTWEFSGARWFQLHPGSSPSPRVYASMVYDGTDKQTLLFGGNDGGFAADTWVYHNGNWKNISGTTRHSPTGRYAAAVAFDGGDGYVLLFGGFGGSYLGDTWEFKGGVWKLLSPLTSPPAIAFSVLAYDPARSVTLMVGGFGCGSPCYGSGMWSFAGGHWVQDFPSSVQPGTASGMSFDPTYEVMIGTEGFYASSTGVVFASNVTYEY